MTVQNNYEIIGNTLKFQFTNPAEGWNKIDGAHFRSLQEIKDICLTKQDVDHQVLCVVDYLNQNAMSTTDFTEFLYRFSGWYIGTPLEGIRKEMERIEAAIPHATNQLANDVSSGMYHAIQQAAHMALDCIISIDWLEVLAMILPI